MTEQLKLSKDDIGWEVYDYGAELIIKVKNVKEYDQLKQQILDDHKKAERWDEYESRVKLSKNEYNTWYVNKYGGLGDKK